MPSRLRRISFTASDQYLAGAQWQLAVSLDRCSQSALQTSVGCLALDGTGFHQALQQAFGPVSFKCRAAADHLDWLQSTSAAASQHSYACGRYHTLPGFSRHDIQEDCRTLQWLYRSCKVLKLWGSHCNRCVTLLTWLRPGRGRDWRGQLGLQGVNCVRQVDPGTLGRGPHGRHRPKRRQRPCK